MDIEKIKQIISGGEDVTTEFKECTDKISNSVYETVCSFLNHKGGLIFIGVKDDGEIIGVFLLLIYTYRFPIDSH